MNSESMLEKLDRYYQSKGISAREFSCDFRDKCRSRCVKGPMISVPESYVGTEYEAGTLPRLLFISSDTNKPDWFDEHPEYGALRKNREIIWRDRNESWFQKPKGHWHQTLELAQAILAPYAKARLGKDVDLNDFVSYIANVRSTRCKDSSIGTKEGAPQMSVNCWGFLKGEIEIMSPDIIVTQGTRARNALWSTFVSPGGRVSMPGNPHHGAFYEEIVQISENHTAIKIVAWHPCARGWSGDGRKQFVDWATKSVHKFIPVT